MSASHSPSPRADPRGALDRLDAQLGEIGRRQHRFSWLRDPVSEDWIVVDAYYPGNRVVVLASDEQRTLATCEAVVPRQGLFLLSLSLDELAADSDALARQLRARLEIQGWERRADPPAGSAPAVPRGPAPPRGAAPDDRADDDFVLDPASRRGAGAGGTAGGLRPVRRRGSARRRLERAGSEGVGVGVTLVIAVVLELIVGGALIGLDAGQYVLGFGFVLDACARVLGMVVGSQTGDLDTAWAAVVVGSPALWGLKPSTDSDLVPVARLTATLAGCLVALGVVIWIL